MNSKLYRSKRGEFNVLLLIIVTLVAGLVLIVAGVTIASKSEDIENDKKCQLSFFAATQMAKVYQKSKRLMDVPVSLECPRRQVEITADGTVMQGGKIIDDLVKSKIAQEMLSCWTKTGSGKLDPTKEGGVFESTEERFCLICSEITFDKKFQAVAAQQNYQIKSLSYWAATRRIPGRKDTLFEAMTGKQVTDIKTLEALKQGSDAIPGSLDLTKEYSVFWRADVYKASMMAKTWKVVGGTLLTGAVLTTLGAVYLSMGPAAIVFTSTATTIASFGIGMATEGTSNQARTEVFIAATRDLSDTKPYPEAEHTFCSFMFN